jgi:hypothetical protein
MQDAEYDLRRISLLSTPVNKSAGFRLLGGVPFWVEFLWYVKCPALLLIPLAVVCFPVAG